MKFCSIHHLLRVFRHFTRDYLRRIGLKAKTRREKPGKGSTLSQQLTAFEMMQLLETTACDEDELVFVIGGCYLSEASYPPNFRFDVLFRHSTEWNERDRMFEDDLEYRKLNPS